MPLWIDDPLFFETYLLDFRGPMTCHRVELDQAVSRPVGITDFPIWPRRIPWILSMMIRSPG